MTAGQAYIWMNFGVFISVIFPILKAAVKPPAAKMAGLPPWVKKYGLIFLFSAVTAVILLAIYLAANPNALANLAWYTAFLFGFSWESAIEKITA